MQSQTNQPSANREQADSDVVELAARAHAEAARVAESHGHLRSARDHRAFSLRVREALRQFDSGGTRGA